MGHPFDAYSVAHFHRRAFCTGSHLDDDTYALVTANLPEEKREGEKNSQRSATSDTEGGAVPQLSPSSLLDETYLAHVRWEG